MNEVRLYRAAWVVPVVSPPVADAAVAVSSGRVVEVGPIRDLTARFPRAETVDLGRSILLPGLTNAHTHLSLTELPHPPPAGTSALEWLEGVARAAPTLTEEDVRRSVRAGIRESIGYGTTLVGDVAPSPPVAEELLAMDASPGSSSPAGSRLAARVFFEFLGVGGTSARDRFQKAAEAALSIPASESIRAGLSPHAPYTVPSPLWAEAAGFVRDHDLRWTTHLAEMPSEREFLLEGTGPMLEFFRSLGVWDGSFPLPGVAGVHLLEREQALDARMLLVHGVHLDHEEIDRVADSGAFVCLCPRSNVHLDLPPPPVDALLTRGVRLCLGTDSKASNDNLSVWGEMREVAKLAPRVSAARLVEMATRDGAEALGMGDAGGSMQPGTAARLIVVPASGLGNGDPLEFLVHEIVDSSLRGI